MFDPQQWIYKAARYELLASTFIYTSQEIVDVLVCEEYSETFYEIGILAGMDDLVLEGRIEKLHEYVGRKNEAVLHALRQEYTRLFIGKKSLVIPYAGVWDSVRQNKEPLLMIGSESMAIERFMRRCGFGRPQGTNEPLDHIASLLEFLYCLCLIRAGALQAMPHAEIHDDDHEKFFDMHFSEFSQSFARSILEHSREPFFTCSAHMLLDLQK